MTTAGKQYLPVDMSATEEDEKKDKERRRPLSYIMILQDRSSKRSLTFTSPKKKKRNPSPMAMSEQQSLSSNPHDQLEKQPNYGRCGEGEGDRIKSIAFPISPLFSIEHDVT